MNLRLVLFATHYTILLRSGRASANSEYAAPFPYSRLQCPFLETRTTRISLDWGTFRHSICLGTTDDLDLPSGQCGPSVNVFCKVCQLLLSLA
ncbi:hypothetical protein K438DRAFT_1832923 [Mycena galopus ATCC 62051]|nr:hypothetical protein K438DRAFT_1832923 [Mycena galopus ATCC 62051]